MHFSIGDSGSNVFVNKSMVLLSPNLSFEAFLYYINLKKHSISKLINLVFLRNVRDSLKCSSISSKEDLDAAKCY